jgi:hypothetical protein
MYALKVFVFFAHLRVYCQNPRRLILAKVAYAAIEASSSGRPSNGGEHQGCLPLAKVVSPAFLREKRAAPVQECHVAVFFLSHGMFICYIIYYIIYKCLNVDYMGRDTTLHPLVLSEIARWIYIDLLPVYNAGFKA